MTNMFFATKKELRYNKRGGYVMIASTLILGAIGVMLSLGVLRQTQQAVISISLLLQKDQSDFAAEACVENALQAINDNPINLSIIDKLEFDEYSCQYQVVDLDNNGLLIKSIGRSGKAISRLEIIIKQIRPQIKITEWRSVADFNKL